MSDLNPNALKHMYGPEFMQRMAAALSPSPQFDKKAFLAITPQLLKLEMKPRVHLIRDELRRQFPGPFPGALKVLMKSLETGKLKGFDHWPYTEFIQAHGLEHFDKSLEALKILTVPFTSEFAVRPFIRRDTERTLKFLLECTRDKEVSVRRWASEGSRSRLPWGEKLHALIEDPHLTFPILDALKFDPELFVRKSVANHLNDIAKDHPQFVLKTLKAWQKEAKGENIDRLNWITRHSLRTLIKKGHPEALKLIGVKTDGLVKLKTFTLNKTRFKMNERLEFSFVLKSLEAKTHKLVIDYRIHYQKAGGKISDKVFKLKTIQLGPGEECEIKKGHHLKHVTTRKHYSGKHHLEIMVNGVSFKKVSWDLEL